MALPGARPVRAPRGTEISTKSWQTEAPLRMLMNNLDPEVAERPDDLVVYGGTGRAARSWEAFDAIVDTLRDLEEDGLIVRTVYRQVPPKVEYELSDLGRSAAPLLAELTRWGSRYRTQAVSDRAEAAQLAESPV